MDKEKEVAAEEVAAEEVAAEEVAAEENKTLDLIEGLRNDFNKKISELKTKYDNEIKEREEVIKSLLNGEQKIESVSERINKNRIFKKW